MHCLLGLVHLLLFYHLNISAGERQVHVNSPRLFPSVPTKSMSFALTVKVGNFVEALNFKKSCFSTYVEGFLHRLWQLPECIKFNKQTHILSDPQSSKSSHHQKSPSERLREKDGKPTGHCGDHSHDEHWCRQPENLVGKKLQLL